MKNFLTPLSVRKVRVRNLFKKKSIVRRSLNTQIQFKISGFAWSNRKLYYVSKILLSVWEQEWKKMELELIIAFILVIPYSEGDTSQANQTKHTNLKRYKN